MAYLGTKPQSGFISNASNQYFTGITQNYIDLNQSIDSLSSVIILVNGVVQENADLTLTSSTRITLGQTTVASDKITCVYLGKITSNQAPSTGSVTSDMLAGSIANSKLATDPLNASNLASGTVPTARLGSGTASSSNFLRGDGSWATAGEVNSPYWFGRKTNLSDQYLTRATKTKITNMSDDEADSHSAYASDRFTVPSGHGGIYLVTGCMLGVASNAGNDGEEFNVFVYKNGVEKRTSGFIFDTGGKFQVVYQNVVGLIELADGDYVELYGELADDNASNTMHINGGVGTHFGGFKIA